SRRLRADHAQRAHEPPVAKLVGGASKRPLEPQRLEPLLLRGEREDNSLGNGAARGRALRHRPARGGERQDRGERAPAAVLGGRRWGRGRSGRCTARRSSSTWNGLGKPSRTPARISSRTVSGEPYAVTTITGWA